ncbi:MAG: response regulator [Pirellulaceae bacterium]
MACIRVESDHRPTTDSERTQLDEGIWDKTMDRLSKTGLVKLFTYRRVVLALLLAWSAAIGGLAWWYDADHTANLTEMARIYSRACHEKDVIYRRWNAAHGGVYVAVTKDFQPNPYLQAAERDVTTPSGRTLTLVNPAYMTRQVHELAANADNIQAHITRLKPLNPKNSPDKWEQEALLSFEKGAQEANVLLYKDDKHTARLMRPLYVDQSCMKCHEQQGYKIGDVRGGISVTVPVDSVCKAQTQQARNVFVALGGIWMLGAVTFVLVGRSTNQRRLEREQGEQILRESEERLQAIIQNTSEIIYTLSPDGVFTYVSPAWSRKLGHDLSEVVGKSFVGFVHPSGVSICQAFLQRALSTGDPQEKVEFRVRHNDGTWYWYQSSGACVKDTDGHPICFVGVGEDITKRKRTEEELIRARQVAEVANRSKSEFLANMSHEIRTPMTAILGFTDILLGNSLTEESAIAAEIIKRNGVYLLDLINNILDLSKIEAGKCTVDLQKCSPSQIAAEVISLMKVRADAKGLPLSLEVQGNIPEKVTTDPIRVRQCLLNLIGNAIKFTEVGGVRVVMRLDSVPEGECKFVFDVIDTGLGMSADQMDLLFRPFSQVDSSACRRFGGTGLGLAISKRMAEMLGGDIVVRSSPGQGSTFSFSIGIGRLDGLAMTQELSQAVTARKPVSDTPQHLDCRILLAEDGPDNQRLIAFLLRKAGAEVELAGNGRIALDLALAAQQAGSPFDLVLMDMQMPDMDGYEVTQKLRSAGFEQPIIALTAHAMTEDRQKCLDAGCDDYLSKPVDPKTFVKLLKQWVAASSPA